jgi:hypothetical protein
MDVDGYPQPRDHCTNYEERKVKAQELSGNGRADNRDRREDEDFATPQADAKSMVNDGLTMPQHAFSRFQPAHVF